MIDCLIQPITDHCWAYFSFSISDKVPLYTNIICRLFSVEPSLMRRKMSAAQLWDVTGLIGQSIIVLTCSLLFYMSSLFQGNKGAVSVRFNIYGCSVCLVNCHLAAHEHLLAERISDYNTIIKEHFYHISETSNILYHE